MTASAARRATLLVVPLALAVLPARGRAGDAACPPTQATDGPGAIDPFRPPAPAATALNAAAKTLYRQGHWDEARAQYHAAEVADPEFLAPVLNIACSFVRQERFADATREVLRLLDRAFVPWSREVLTAADLGALKVQPQMAQVRQALADDARRWGTALEGDLLFVARQREPLKLPPANGGKDPVVLVLGLHQEVFAWSPVTGRYRQVTADDGRVLAMAQSIDRRRILYVTADKLVRNAKAPPTLRGVVLHTLELPAMAPRGTVAIDGDVARLTLAPAVAGFALTIQGTQLHGGYVLGGDAGELIPDRRAEERRPGARPSASPAGSPVVLTGSGVAPAPARPVVGADPCRMIARPGISREGIATIEIVPAGRKASGVPPLVLRSRFGAGLAGLSIP